MEDLSKNLININIEDKKDNANKNEENKIGESKEESPEEKEFREKLMEIKENIRELKVLFDQNNPKKYKEDKIENYILFENLVNFDKIKQKIIDIFKNDDIYSILFDLWNKIIEFSKNKNKQNIEETKEENEHSEDKNKKNKQIKIFNKILMILNFFTPKIINNTKDNAFKEKICESIFANIQLTIDIEEGQYFLYYFTEVFGTKEIFKEQFIKQYKEEMTNIICKNLAFGINFINIFDL